MRQQDFYVTGSMRSHDLVVMTETHVVSRNMGWVLSMGGQKEQTITLNCDDTVELNWLFSRRSQITNLYNNPVKYDAAAIQTIHAAVGCSSCRPQNVWRPASHNNPFISQFWKFCFFTKLKTGHVKNFIRFKLVFKFNEEAQVERKLLLIW